VSGHPLLSPPATQDQQLVRVVVDSRDRSTLRYPTPSDYEVVLGDDVRMVTGIELAAADVPLSAYMVCSANALVHFTANGGAEKVAALAIGDYVDAADVAAEAQRALNEAEGSDFFRVEYGARLDRFTVRGAQPFALLFKGEVGSHGAVGTQTTLAYREGSAGRLLGFGMLDAESAETQPATSHPHSVTAGFRKNLDTNRYAVLHVEPAGTTNADYAMSASSATNGSFALLVRRGADQNYVGGSDRSQVRYAFEPAIPRMNRLRIRFTGYDGLPYDFQNQEHRLELVFTRTRWS